MRTAWNIITLVALANLIAIVGFVWWLHFSGRLDMDRVEAVRTMLSETISEQTTREQTEEAQAAQEAVVNVFATPSEWLSTAMETSRSLEVEAAALASPLAERDKLAVGKQVLVNTGTARWAPA